MEKYLVITAKKNDVYSLVEIDSDSLKITKAVKIRGTNIPSFSDNCRPINFSIENGVIKESMGSLDRLKVKDGICSCIILQELVNMTGVILGYRLLNPSNFSIMALKKNDILLRQKNSPIPILQNGIIRGNKINCYPASPFPRCVIGSKPKAKPEKIKLSDDMNKESKESNDFLSQFTSEQRRELFLANKDGVPVSLIANPKLSPQQMRVLWVSKKNGAFSEYFAKPEYSVDVMMFYADRLLTSQMTNACADLLSRPSYSVAMLTELYLAICEGIDYSSFINMGSAEEMRIQREMLRSSLWDSSSNVRLDEFISDGLAFANKVRNSKN